MTEHNVFAMANEFLRRQRMAHMKLQKLLYVTLGWGLAITGEPIIRNRVEAWDGGPVFPELYRAVRHTGRYDDNGLLLDDNNHPYHASLSRDQTALIDAIWQKYGDYSASELSNMTHQPGTPWTKTYLEGGRNTPIPLALIQNHFIELAQAGRETQ